MKKKEGIAMHTPPSIFVCLLVCWFVGSVVFDDDDGDANAMPCLA